MHLAARQRRLDDVRRVHRPFGRTRADDRVQLVDEEDHILRAADLVHHRLDALLKLSAVFRPRDHQREVQRDYPLVPQQLRHVPVRNLLGESFDDRRLPHARFADQHRVILRPPAEHLDHALDLILAPDHRIDLALLGQFGQVTAKSAQRGRLDILLPAARSLGGLPCGCSASPSGGVKFGSSSRRISLQSALDIDFEILEDTRGHAFAFPQQAEQDMLRAHVRVVERLRFLPGQRQHLLHPRGVGNIPHHFRLGSEPTCFSTSIRTVSRSRPIFWSTFTATPWPSLINPSKRCSVPT